MERGNRLGQGDQVRYVSSVGAMIRKSERPSDASSVVNRWVCHEPILGFGKISPQRLIILRPMVFLNGSVMFSIIYLSENIEFGIMQVLSVVNILRLVYIFCVSYLYMLNSHTYMCCDMSPFNISFVVRFAFQDLYCRYMPRIAMPIVMYSRRFEPWDIPASADRLIKP